MFHFVLDRTPSMNLSCSISFSQLFVTQTVYFSSPGNSIAVPAESQRNQLTLNTDVSTRNLGVSSKDNKIINSPLK